MDIINSNFSNVVSFSSFLLKRRKSIERTNVVDTKQKLINWRSIFNNSSKYSELEQKAADKIADLCHELPDNDNEKLTFVRIAVNFSSDKEKVKKLLKTFIELANNCEDISEKMSCYRSIVNHDDTDQDDKSTILNKMVNILESYDESKPLPPEVSEVIHWSDITASTLKTIKSKKSSKPKSKKPTKKDS